MYKVQKIFFEFGDFEGIKLLLDDELDINSHDLLGRTLLTWAAAKGRSDIVEFLAQRGANVNPCNVRESDLLDFDGCSAFDIEILTYNRCDRDYSGVSPLMYACVNGHFEIADYLVKNGADINAQDSIGWNALMYSILGRNMDDHKRKKLITLLIEHGADVNMKDSSKCTALMMACRSNNFMATKLLLDAGASVNEQSDTGRTALLNIKRDFIKSNPIVELLVKNGADINLQDEDGITFFMRLCEVGDVKDIAKMYEYVTDVNIEDWQNRTALMHALFVQGNLQIVDFLISKGAKTETEEESVLHWAAMNSDRDVFLHLYRKGASIIFEDNTGKDVFDKACIYGRYDLIDVMLENGEDINRVSEEYKDTHLMKLCLGCQAIFTNTPLQRVAMLNLPKIPGFDDPMDEEGITFMKDQSYYSKMAQYLIDKGCNVNARNEFGYTALSFACMRGSAELALTLIKNGADVNTREEYLNRTPLMWAMGGNYPNAKLIETLIASGANVNDQDDDGNTALMVFLKDISEGASYEKLIPRENFLYLYEVDNDILTKRSIDNFRAIVKVMVVNGADLSIRNKKGERALDFYAQDLSEVLNEVWIKEMKERSKIKGKTGDGQSSVAQRGLCNNNDVLRQYRENNYREQ